MVLGNASQKITGDLIYDSSGPVPMLVDNPSLNELIWRATQQTPPQHPDNMLTFIMTPRGCTPP
eukprot:11946940-Heterocapsa_arctica.AAC.1